LGPQTGTPAGPSPFVPFLLFPGNIDSLSSSSRLFFKAYFFSAIDGKLEISQPLFPLKEKPSFLLKVLFYPTSLERRMESRSLFPFLKRSECFLQPALPSL